jgi:UDP-N-acetylmuramoyl-tripeptide--D-alanyl-D-alanine ligase
VINDCYNANPVSMRAALDHLASLDSAGRRVAVLGGMAELGPDGPTYHREAGAHARRLGIEPIIGVGELARDYVPDSWARDADAAAAPVSRMLEPGDAVLVKGSRAIELERLTDELVQRRGK